MILVWNTKKEIKPGQFNTGYHLINYKKSFVSFGKAFFMGEKLNLLFIIAFNQVEHELTDIL